MSRKAISKKSRFEVFKRDSFTCVYCGCSPPGAVLELDHIEPVSKGGTNDIINLVTSCFDCNRGKGATPLSSIPNSISENLALIQEKELQIKEFRKFINQVKRRKNRDIKKVSDIFALNYEGYILTEHFKKNSIGLFLEKLPLHEVEEAMEIACERVQDYSKAARYFCGVCWNKIRS